MVRPIAPPITKSRTRQSWRRSLLTVNQHGTYTLLSGTGKYAKISGHGTYQENILAIDARFQGRCAQRKPPVALQLIIWACGPAGL